MASKKPRKKAAASSEQTEPVQPPPATAEPTEESSTTPPEVVPLERSIEELKASNEEIVSINEKLQSLNEELSTVNNQLQEKVEELVAANNDMTNLLNCTEVATVFLDASFRIKRFTPAAAKLFNLSTTDVGRSIGDITAHFRDPDLLGDAQQVLRQLAPLEKEVSTGENAWWVRRIVPCRTTDNRIEGVVLTFTDVTLLKRANEELERQVAERTRSLSEREERLQSILNTVADAIITINQGGLIQSVNSAAEQMFGYTAAEMIGQNVKMLMPSPYRDAHDGYLARYLQTGEKHIIGIGREVEGRRKDGSVFPLNLAVSENEHLKLFTGILHDLTRRKELEREIVEIASLQQKRIGQDLHDYVGQELTALNLLAGDLAEALRNGSTNAADLVGRMAEGLQRSQQKLRGVIQGLLPVAVDTLGLMAALADLADHTQRQGNVACVFDCPKPVSVADNLTATHLYLIAQEAVHNALKHAQPRNIRIRLEANDSLVLRVQDDGIGMPALPADHRGLGLRIMRNRAAIIGAKLTVEPAQPPLFPSHGGGGRGGPW